MNRRRREPARLADPDPLGLEIQEVLEDDLRLGGQLMLNRYRSVMDDSLGGYCTIATEAYFFLQDAAVKDPRKGGELQPYVKSYGRDGSHWWLVRKTDQSIIDLTLRPGEGALARDYEGGRRTGFMMHGYKAPSQTRSAVDRPGARETT